MKFYKRISFACFFVCICISVCTAASDKFSWERYDEEDDEWFKSAKAKTIAENLLSWQDDYGAWPKNVDSGKRSYTGDRLELEGTFDNKSTTEQMYYLAHIYNVTKEPSYKAAFIKGLDLIIKSQYPSGGWPQRYPPGKGYAKHITFNDGVMVLLLELLKDVAGSNEYEFVGTDRQKAAQEAFDKGVDCILKCQIKLDGKPAVWCAQHDEVNYTPCPARSFELASLSGGESAGILKLLMKIDRPSPEVVKAIQGGVDWYNKSAIKGVRAFKADGKYLAEKDPDADPIWARFYELETNRPFFCNRDGIPLYDYDQLDKERSMGYKWYGDWGEDVFKYYKKWSAKYDYLILDKDTKIIAIIGDSTVCEYKKSDVRRGWGHYIQGYFNDSVKVINKARSGRSTKTFIEQGWWQEILDMKPAYVLIQFGHNDSHDPGRKESTDASTDYKEYLRKYIGDCRQMGARPVLVTPMYRRKFNDTGTKIKDNLLPYAQAMKEVAKEKNVSVIDLNGLSEKLYLELGPEKVLELANKSGDQTHFNHKGATAMAELVMGQLPTVEPSLKDFLRSKD